MNLLNNNQLDWSPIVANSRMNRQRKATGVNSYEKDIGLNVISFLEERLQQGKEVAWLDLCCGEGNALIEVGQYFYTKKQSIRIIGIDLVDMFTAKPTYLEHVTLVAQSLRTYNKKITFDLVTCVHGLHYVGDKLNSIQQAILRLKKDGFFIANLDANNLKIIRQKTSKNVISSLQNQGIDYNARKRLISCTGQRVLEMPFQYIGADDTAGANYTGQEVVNSFYKKN